MTAFLVGPRCRKKSKERETERRSIEVNEDVRSLFLSGGISRWTFRCVFLVDFVKRNDTSERIERNVSLSLSLKSDVYRRIESNRRCESIRRKYVYDVEEFLEDIVNDEASYNHCTSFHVTSLFANVD